MSQRNRSSHYTPPILAASREVLVVDNAPLRQRHFLAAQKVIQKIERLEKKIQTFHTSDQKLFNQWVDLTFRSHREAQLRLQNKYSDLVQFHNWVVATSHKLNIEMPKAYALMRDEQIRWNNGTQEEREAIEALREQREAYIRQKINGSYNERYSYEDRADDDSEEEYGDLLQILKRVEDFAFDEDVEEGLSADERVDRMIHLSDKNLREVLENEEFSFLLFDFSLNWGEVRQDYSLFKRIWPLMESEQQDYFSQVFSSLTGEPMEEFLKFLGIGSSARKGQRDDLEDEDDEETILREEGFEDPRQRGSSERKAAPKKAEPVNEEKLKSAFRKLMRKLHPDVHAAETKDGSQPQWVQRMWTLVQTAYNSKNVGHLERLLKLTLLRMNNLDELTMTEIAEAHHWLKQDYEALEEESSDLKYSPAWGFSLKKNYNAITERIEKQFNSEMLQIRLQLDELERQHGLLEMLSQRSQRQPRSTPRRERGGGGSPTGRGRSRRRSRNTSSQQEFSFEDF